MDGFSGTVDFIKGEGAPTTLGRSLGTFLLAISPIRLILLPPKPSWQSHCCYLNLLGNHTAAT
jgi:hypothetical protein